MRQRYFRPEHYRGTGVSDLNPDITEVFTIWTQVIAEVIQIWTKMSKMYFRFKTQMWHQYFRTEPNVAKLFQHGTWILIDKVFLIFWNSGTSAAVVKTDIWCIKRKTTQGMQMYCHIRKLVTATWCYKDGPPTSVLMWLNYISVLSFFYTTVHISFPQFTKYNEVNFCSKDHEWAQPISRGDKSNKHQPEITHSLHDHLFIAVSL